MAWQSVPLMRKQNNTMNVQLDLASRVTYQLFFRYNPIGEYWTMDVYNAAGDEPIVCGVPLLTGDFPAADLFRQMEYLGIGSCAIRPLTDVSTDHPGLVNLAAEFEMYWGDSVAVEA